MLTVTSASDTLANLSCLLYVTLQTLRTFSLSLRLSERLELEGIWWQGLPWKQEVAVSKCFSGPSIDSSAYGLLYFRKI